MGNLFFTIIIPTLNEEDYLPRLLNNLKSQTKKDFEVIIVDGYSNDKTVEKGLSFRKELPISLFKVKKNNVSTQRNFGAMKAKGRYLIFLDADTQVSSGFISQLKKIINKKPGLVYIPSLKPEDSNYQYKIFFKLINYLVELSQSFNRPFSSGGSLIFEKDFFLTIGGFNEKLFISEDHNLLHKAKNWGVTAKFLRNVFVKFSLRRLKKEGELVVFYKYLLASIHSLLKGKIDKKIFDYKMGGHWHKSTNERNNIEEGFKQLKRFLKKQIKILTQFKFS